jgi:hypothetical protein
MLMSNKNSNNHDIEILNKLRVDNDNLLSQILIFSDCINFNNIEHLNNFETIKNIISRAYEHIDIL